MTMFQAIQGGAYGKYNLIPQGIYDTTKLDPSGTFFTQAYINALVASGNITLQFDVDDPAVIADVNKLKLLDIDIKNPPPPFNAAVGDGQANDTDIIQNILNSLKDNQKIIISDGTFCVKNLIIPNKSIIIEQRGLLKKITGGDNDYVVCSEGYAKDWDFAGAPFKYINPRIDGNNIATHGLILQTWNTTVETPSITKCVHGLVFSTVSRNNIQFATSTLVNNRILFPNISGNTGNGIYIKDPSRNKVTDMFIQKGFSFSNAIGIKLDSCAGTLIEGTHTYGNTTRGLEVSIGSLAFRIHSCYFEESESIALNDILANNFVNLKGNTINGRVRLYSYNVNVGIQSENNTFRTLNGKFVQTWGNSVVLSNNDTFQCSDPFTNVGGDGSGNSAAPNLFFVKNAISSVIGVNRIINGVVKSNKINTVSFGNSAPSSGSFTNGDKQENTSVSAGAYSGWYCVTSGIANNAAWAQNTAYTVGQQVNAGGRVYEVVTAGTSGTAAPTGTNASIIDGTVTWKYAGVLAVFKGYGLIQS
jgi:hypothetical protein